MAVRNILLLGDPLLRKDCERILPQERVLVQETITDLGDTLADFRSVHGFGRGIAAPQIGIAKQIIFINIDRPLPIINPEIIHRSKEMMTLWDDCFSFPDILVKVKRHARIEVQFTDQTGETCLMEAQGGLSELLQHEIDHLHGILAIDRAIDSHHIVLRSEWKKMGVTRSPVY